MQLFAGLDQTDYQDILRALGYLCDVRGWRNLRLVEHEDGLIVQFTEGAGLDFTLYLFTDDDLRALLQEAYNRRIPVAAIPTAPAARPHTDRLVAPPGMEPPATDRLPADETAGEEAAAPFEALLDRVNSRTVQ